ncbi:nitrogen regulation protein NR(II) [Candidatus Sumerlaeota bacterium]
MPHTIDREQQEYRRWLLATEKRAILPIKWLMLLTGMFLWQYSRNLSTMPRTEVFALFFIYGMFNLAFSYCIWLRDVSLRQVRVFSLVSYTVDIIFVTMLIYLDLVLADGRPMRSDYYVFYLVLVLRGFAIFRHRAEGMLFSLAILGLFIATSRAGLRSFEFVTERPFVLQLFLIWMTVLFSWCIMEMVRQQQSDLARARENLARSESLAMVGEMASSVAHEINNPVGIISAYAEFLMQQTDKDDPHLQDFAILADEARRVKAIVSEMLDFSRPVAPVSQEVDLCGLNDEVIRFVFHDRANKNIAIDLDYREAPPLRIDPIQVKQALVNIYLNAKQAMQDSGRIDVSISLAPPAKAFGRQRVAVRISDSGAGIAPEQLERAFEPFYSSKDKGTGLGLTVTRRIIESHGGVVEMRAREDGPGTTVEFFLPLTNN